MRIEDSTPSTLRGRSVGRASDASSSYARLAKGRSTGSDEVSLSGLAQLMGGPPAGRIESLRDEVSTGAYHVPADQISQRIVDYYLD